MPGSGGLWYWDFGLGTALPLPCSCLLLTMAHILPDRQLRICCLPGRGGVGRGSMGISVSCLVDVLSFA